MIYGLVAAVLAVKVMISDAAGLAEELELVSAPIFGGGALPFRGHVRLENLPGLLKDFGGIKTVTIQSGLRYDHAPGEAAKVAALLRKELPGSQPRRLDDDEVVFVKDVLVRFAAEYMSVFGTVAGLATKLAEDIVPQQRDRLTSRGPTGYARRAPNPNELSAFTGDSNLIARLRSITMPADADIPRAISYTAALYTVGLPPEFIGVGGGLAAVAKAHGDEGVARLLEFYPGLSRDLDFASHFLSMKVAARFFDPAFIETLKNDISETEKHLNASFLDRPDQAYETLLEIIEPLVRQTLRGEALGEEDKALLRSCTARLGKLRGSLG